MKILEEFNPRSFLSPSVGRRLMLWIISISTGIVLLGTSLQLFFDYQLEIQRIDQDIEEIEKTFVPTMAYSVWQMDHEQLEVGLRGLLLYESIKFVELNVEGGEQFTAGGKDKSPDEFENLSVREIPIRLDYNSKIWNLGKMLVYIDIESVYAKKLEQSFKIIVNNLLLMVAVLISVGLLSWRLVTVPLNVLAEHTKNIRFRGSNNQSVPRDYMESEDEIGQLFRSVAVLEDNLNEDYKIRIAAEHALQESRNDLEKIVKDRTSELKRATKDLVDSSRKAGMAEVATGVLHNIGNVLTSVNLKVQRLEERLSADTSSARVGSLAELFEKFSENPDELLDDKAKVAKIAAYLAAVSEELQKTKDGNLELANVLIDGIKHVIFLVSQQQSHARHTGLIKDFSITEAIRDVLRLSSIEIEKSGIDILFNDDQDLNVTSDRHKVLQIITNIVTNAIQAIQGTGHPGRIRITQAIIDDRVQLVFSDNGVGIEEETMKKLFVFGFTTKETGNGFGLHSSALDASNLGGKLEVSSLGAGLGATFTLEIPVDMEQKSKAS